MKKKRLFYGILALISFQAWGMDDIRAKNILRQLPGKRAIVQKTQDQLRELNQKLSELRREIAVINNLQAQLEIAKGEVKDAKELEAGIRGVEGVNPLEVDRAITAHSKAEEAYSALFDRIKVMKPAETQLGLIENQIAAIQRQEDDALNEIDHLMDDLGKIHPDVVQEGLNLMTEQERENIQAALQEEASVRAQIEAARAAAQREATVLIPPAAAAPVAGGGGGGSATASGSRGPTPAAAPQFTIGKKTTGAIITAIALAIATYIGTRIYQKKKNRLIRKYKLAPLTNLQNSVWRAIALAHIRMPWYLQYLIKNNKGTVSDFLGSDPRAAAEFYYGRTASEADVQRFIQRFFGRMK